MGYSLAKHYFIPNVFKFKGEYNLYIYAQDNGATIKKSSCT